MEKISAGRDLSPQWTDPAQTRLIQIQWTPNTDGLNQKRVQWYFMLGLVCNFPPFVISVYQLKSQNRYRRNLLIKTSIGATV